MQFFQRLSPNIKGIVLMLIGTLLVTVNLLFMRRLSNELPTFELVFLRYVFALMALSPLILKTGVSKVFYSRRLKLHAIRAFIAVNSIALWYVGITLVPLAQAVALNSLSVIFLAIGAVMFLGEPSLPTRWFAVGSGFLGMLVIVRPGLDGVSAGTLVVIVSALMWSVCLLFLKVLGRSDSALTLVAFLYGFALLFSAPLSLTDWTQPNLEQLVLLSVTGVFSAVGHLSITHAFRDAEATVVIPVDFMRLVWAAVIGYLAYREIPEVWTLLGGLIIFGSTVYISLAERRRRIQG